jgi:hypothetical protein
MTGCAAAKPVAATATGKMKSFLENPIMYDLPCAASVLCPSGHMPKFCSGYPGHFAGFYTEVPIAQNSNWTLGFSSDAFCIQKIETLVSSHLADKSCFPGK